MSVLLIVIGLIMLAVGILQKISLYRKYSRNFLSEKSGGRRIYDRGYKKTRQMKSINNSMPEPPEYNDNSSQKRVFHKTGDSEAAHLYRNNRENLTNIDKKSDKSYEKNKDKNSNRNNVIRKDNDKPKKDKFVNEEQEIRDFKSILNQSQNKLNLFQLPDKYRDVIVLNEKHKNADEIARELDLGVRETKLILKFHREKADINGR